jgi:hypothetical protein
MGQTIQNNHVIRMRGFLFTNCCKIKNKGAGKLFVKGLTFYTY